MDQQIADPEVKQQVFAPAADTSQGLAAQPPGECLIDGPAQARFAQDQLIQPTTCQGALQTTTDDLYFRKLGHRRGAVSGQVHAVGFPGQAPIAGSDARQDPWSDPLLMRVLNHPSIVA